VSTLFSGNPNLIQGFNTFLPPGYRIECSDDPLDPNPIKVTTPMGATTILPSRPPEGRRNYYNESRIAWSERETYDENSPSYERPRTEMGAFYGGSGTQMAQLQAAASGRRSDSKTPIEFNHAINYVNKIKVRFQLRRFANSRLGSQTIQISIRTSWKFCRPINENKGRSIKSMPKSRDSSMGVLIFWMISNNFSPKMLGRSSPVHRYHLLAVCLPWEVLRLLLQLYLPRRSALLIPWSHLRCQRVDLSQRYVLISQI
jgi:hypothetical protein